MYKVKINSVPHDALPISDLAEPADARAGSEPGWICLRACFWHRDCRGEPCREPVAHRCCTSHSSARLAPSGPLGSVLALAVLAALVPDQSGTCSDRQHRDPGARAEIDTGIGQLTDRKSTRLNSSHVAISY